jgi:hypothetical protein
MNSWFYRVLNHNIVFGILKLFLKIQTGLKIWVYGKKLRPKNLVILPLSESYLPVLYQSISFKEK